MLTIRTAGPGDAETILTFIQALAEYEREPDAVRVDATSLRAQLSEPTPPFECLFAEHLGRPIGFALFFHTYSTWRGKRGLWLEDLFVLPDERRRGAGRLLLGELARIAVARDCARLEWSVLDWNAPAIAFYEGLGASLLHAWTICRVSDQALATLAAAE